MTITINITNPFKKIKEWFLYDIFFWRLIEVKTRRLGFMDIDHVEMSLYVVRHIITGKIICHDGWGKNISQNSIYNVNKVYNLMK